VPNKIKAYFCDEYNESRCKVDIVRKPPKIVRPKTKFLVYKSEQIIVMPFVFIEARVLEFICSIYFNDKEEVLPIAIKGILSDDIKRYRKYLKVSKECQKVGVSDPVEIAELLSKNVLSIVDFDVQVGTIFDSPNYGYKECVYLDLNPIEGASREKKLTVKIDLTKLPVSTKMIHIKWR
jgi:hypothetical protein